MNMLLKMTIYSGITQLQNGGSFHSYVSLPEGKAQKKMAMETEASEDPSPGMASAGWRPRNGGWMVSEGAPGTGAQRPAIPCGDCCTSLGH